MQKVTTIAVINTSNQEITSNPSATDSMGKIISTQPTIGLIKIDFVKLLEYGDSPTAIILSMAVFTAVLLRSLKREIPEQ